MQQLTKDIKVTRTGPKVISSMDNRLLLGKMCSPQDTNTCHPEVYRFYTTTYQLHVCPGELDVSNYANGLDISNH